jgi:hypothetical protein
VSTEAGMATMFGRYAIYSKHGSPVIRERRYRLVMVNDLQIVPNRVEFRSGFSFDRTPFGIPQRSGDLIHCQLKRPFPG